MTERDPRMLPGQTALAATTLSTGLMVGALAGLVIGVFAALISAVVAGSRHLHSPGATGVIGLVFLVIVIVCLAAFGPASVRARRIEAAELEAGYTTLLKQFDQVDGIDARSGLVVRPAVVRPSGGALSSVITSGAELGAIEPVARPLIIVLRRPWIAVGFGLSVVAFFGSLLIIAEAIYGSIGTDVLTVIAVVASPFALCASIIVPAVALAILPGRHYADLLARSYGGSRAYAGELQDYDIPLELLPQPNGALPFARPRLTNYAVFDSKRLILYSRRKTALLPYLVIPRERIADAEVGYVPAGRGPDLPALKLTITKDDGATTPLVYSFEGSGGQTSRKRMEAVSNWAVAWAKDQNPAT